MLSRASAAGGALRRCYPRLEVKGWWGGATTKTGAGGGYSDAQFKDGGSRDETVDRGFESLVGTTVSD